MHKVNVSQYGVLDWPDICKVLGQLSTKVVVRDVAQRLASMLQQ